MTDVPEARRSLMAILSRGACGELVRSSAISLIAIATAAALTLAVQAREAAQVEDLSPTFCQFYNKAPQAPQTFTAIFTAPLTLQKLQASAGETFRSELLKQAKAAGIEASMGVCSQPEATFVKAEKARADTIEYYRRWSTPSSIISWTPDSKALIESVTKSAGKAIPSPGPGSVSAAKALLPSSYQKSARELAIEAEVQRLGSHRRAEAERLVIMRERAEAARGKALPAAPAAKAVSNIPAFVRPPNLTQTKPPPGFHDSNRFVTVAHPSEASAMFGQSYGTCNGQVRYLSSACYPDGTGRYSCQARVRCPLNKAQSGRAE